MTKKEKKVVLAVFDCLMKEDFSTINKFMGSMTIKDMETMYYRLKYEDYCKRVGKSYEELDDSDFETIYEEEVFSNGG